MRDLVLDERLETLAALVGDAATAADIGADHGLLACALLERMPARRMIVSDISAPSLDKARRLLGERGLLDRARLCVADGLGGLDAPVEAIVIAGMGGGTIRAILEAGRDRIENARLVLQPNLDADRLRADLCAGGFVIEDERVALCAGRYYPIICARQGVSAPLAAREAFLGPVLLRTRPARYADYLAWMRGVRLGELARVRQGRSARAQARRRELDEQIAWIEEALAWTPR